jgi:hypothetical protein
MARVLAAGGFPEKALSRAASLRRLGELPARSLDRDTPAHIPALLDPGAFASQAEAALSALWSPAGGHGVGLIDDATLVALRSMTENGQRPHEMKVGRGRPVRTVAG